MEVLAPTKSASVAQGTVQKERSSTEEGSRPDGDQEELYQSDMCDALLQRYHTAAYLFSIQLGSFIGAANGRRPYELLCWGQNCNIQLCFYLVGISLCGPVPPISLSQVLIKLSLNAFHERYSITNKFLPASESYLDPALYGPDGLPVFRPLIIGHR